MAVPVTIWIMVMANTRAGILLVKGHTVGASGAICEQCHAPAAATVHGAHWACRGPRTALQRKAVSRHDKNEWRRAGAPCYRCGNAARDTPRGERVWGSRCIVRQPV